MTRDQFIMRLSAKLSLRFALSQLQAKQFVEQIVDEGVRELGVFQFSERPQVGEAHVDMMAEIAQVAIRWSMAKAPAESADGKFVAIPKKQWEILMRTVHKGMARIKNPNATLPTATDSSGAESASPRLQTTGTLRPAGQDGGGDPAQNS